MTIRQCSTFEVTFSYVVVTVGRDGIAYERCWFDECSPVSIDGDTES